MLHLAYHEGSTTRWISSHSVTTSLRGPRLTFSKELEVAGHIPLDQHIPATSPKLHSNLLMISNGQLASCCMNTIPTARKRRAACDKSSGKSCTAILTCLVPESSHFVDLHYRYSGLQLLFDQLDCSPHKSCSPTTTTVSSTTLSKCDRCCSDIFCLCVKRTPRVCTGSAHDKNNCRQHVQMILVCPFV